MKMYIVKEEQEFKILKVKPELEQEFQQEFGQKVITQGKDLGELINNFQKLDMERMHINNSIGSFKQGREEANNQEQLIQKRRHQF